MVGKFVGPQWTEFWAGATDQLTGSTAGQLAPKIRVLVKVFSVWRPESLSGVGGREPECRESSEVFGSAPRASLSQNLVNITITTANKGRFSFHTPSPQWGGPNQREILTDIVFNSVCFKG